MTDPTDSSLLLRTLDAAANRAGEGLRVVEDYARFVLDDRHLTALAKELRHELATALEDVPLVLRQHARQIEADVGTTLSTPAEEHRGDAWSVCVASLKRLQQALRSLEEYGKVLDETLGERLGQLRYRSYALESALGTTQANVERLAGVRLCVLVDGGADAESFSALIDALVTAGTDAIQLRDKRLSDRDLVTRARLLRAKTRGSQTLAIINDRPDVAALSDADGVHVGQDDCSVKDARMIAGCRRLVGLSTHSLDQARRAVLDGADYIGVGPTFPSTTKAFTQFPGLDLVQNVAREIRLPAFAIGGVTHQNVGQVRGAGLDRVAVGAAITAAANPCAAAAEMRKRLS